MSIARLDRASRPRRTARRLEDYERNLFCTRCGELVAVFEACQGAATEDAHHFTVAESFVCFFCLQGGRRRE